MTRELLPVCRPLLPPADAVATYLRLADGARHYTNRGQLVRRLEQRLAQALGLPDHALRTASNGTSAIEIAVLAVAGPATPARPFALVPSYSFAATGLAVERLGYRPIFTDIDPETWGMDLAAAARHPLLDRIGVIVPVAPYGRRPDLAGAEALHRATGIPVVIDAAASFERLWEAPGHVSALVPMTVSFHATKTFSTGEGGAVIWDNAEGQDRVVRAANFGFNYSRKTETAGTNAKMSEYHAAVGLAMLDGFAERLDDYAATVRRWAQAAAVLPGRMILPPDLASVYIQWQAPSAAALDAAQEALAVVNIDSRRWYEAGMHLQPHFATPDQPALPVTEDLGGRLLGLPMAHDMAAPDMARVVNTILGALA
jgi:dTDP-4-amino-4,6-dideoxygalactose transaminase